MVTLDTLNQWLAIPRENEHLEFKEAKQQYDKTKLLEYCVALANEGGGHLVLGVNNKLPRKVVGTAAFNDTGDIKSYVLAKLNFRIEVYELNHPDGRVLVFEIPSRATKRPHHLNGAYLMRSGEELVPMTPEQLERIFLEAESSWLSQIAKENVTSDEVITLLNTLIYFDLIKLPYPTQQGVLDRFVSEKLIKSTGDTWAITNLGAILFAKSLSDFPSSVSRKAPRIIIYKGADKLETQSDNVFMLGYVVCFEALVTFVHAAAPQNHFVEQVIRQEVKMFPAQALRELIANALIHQDFTITGTSVMIEMYSDRLEISNPGIPPIRLERFIDEYRSRNEYLADLMRRLHISEEKGSGIDKVIKAAEVYQLPAPDFRAGEIRTTAILFAHQDFSDMSKADRIRACYQHCCLLYIKNQRMSNQTLRERFQLDESKNSIVSVIINATKEAGLIKQDETNPGSVRYTKYLPFWA
jgi:ATP-dependent DNA helicase RecG